MKMNKEVPYLCEVDYCVDVYVSA